MKKSVLVLLLLALTSVASAADLESTLSQNDGRTIFQKLAAYFDGAALPSPQEFRGWTSGRCFNQDEQDKALPALLVGFDATDREGSVDNGPLFPPVEWQTFKFLVVAHGSASAGFFDALSDSARREVQMVVDNDSSKISAARVENGSYASEYEASNTRYLLRTDGRYLFTRVVVMKDHEPYRAGDTFSLCYYFKKVK